MSFGLSFSKTEEPVFLESYFRGHLRDMRASMLLGAIIWALFGVIDVWVAPRAILPQLLFVRYAIVCPILLLCWAVSFFPNPHKYLDYVIITGILAAALSVIVRTAFLPEAESAVSALSLLVIFIYGYVVMRPRFIYGSITGVLIVLGYGIVVIGINPIPYGMLVKNFFYLVMGNVLGMYTCYKMEAYVRLDYLNAQRLRKEIERRIKTAQELLRHASSRITQDIYQ